MTIVFSNRCSRPKSRFQRGCRLWNRCRVMFQQPQYSSRARHKNQPWQPVTFSGKCLTESGKALVFENSIHLDSRSRALFWILIPFPSVDTIAAIVFHGYRVGICGFGGGRVRLRLRGVGQEIIPAASAPQDGTTRNSVTLN